MFHNLVQFGIQTMTKIIILYTCLYQHCTIQSNVDIILMRPRLRIALSVTVAAPYPRIL